MSVLFWRRKNARLAARINGVIETSDRIRQSYQPKPPRVVIDTTYIEQANLQPEPTLDEIDQSAGQYAHETVGAMQDTAVGDASPLAVHDDEASAAGVPAEGHAGNTEEALIDGPAAPDSMAGWRQLAQHFMAEARNEKAARLEVEALCEEAVRCAEEAQAELARLRESGGGDSGADAKRISDANLREAEARKREAEALLREAAAREEAEAQRQLAARAEIGAKHALSARREAEVRRDETILRLAQMQSELQAARESTSDREAIALAETAAKAREAEARQEIEARQKQIESQRAELEAVKRQIEAISRDVESRRRRIETLEAERTIAATAQMEAEAARDAALRQVGELESRFEAERTLAGDRDDMARRESEARTGEAAARREAEKTREQLARLEAALEAALEAERVGAGQQSAEREAHLAAIARQKAEIEAERTEAARLRAEVETQRAEAARHKADAERLGAEAKSQADRRTSASAKTDELAAELAAAKSEIEALKASGTPSGADAALLEEARLREAGAREELETLRGQVQRFEQEAQKVELARSQANEARLKAELAGAEAKGALEAVRDSARSREAALERHVADLQKQVASLEAATKAAWAQAERSGETKARDAASNAQSEGEASGGRVFKSDPLARTSSAARFVTPRDAPLSKRKSSASAPGATKPAEAPAEPAEKQASASADDAVEQITDDAGLLATDEAAAETEVVPGSTHSASGGSEKRRAKRVPASIPASVWGKGMGSAMACTIRDKSSSGALLEFVLDRYKERVSGFSVGDQLTLTINTSKERTTVPCVVVRIDGRKAGVRFNGQFRTEMIKQKRQAKADTPEKKSAAMQLTKSLFGSNR